MIQQFWEQLSEPFRHFVLRFQPDSDPDGIFHDWLDGVDRQALQSFQLAANAVGNDAASLRQRVQATEHCHNVLRKYRNSTHPKE